MEIYVYKVINKENECVVLKVDEDCNLWPYIIFDTTFNEKGEKSNINRHCYIFPNHNVEKGDYVLLYTGTGKDTRFRNKAKSTTHVFHWGFDTDAHVWNGKNDEVLLVKIDDFKRTKI